jgi:hypothetical protein
MNGGAALIAALRGPLMLTVFGGLLMIHRFQDISFWKTWPVLLILLGLMKLLERLASRAPSESPEPGGGL